MTAREPGTRVCFTMRLKPGRVDDYLEAHTTVWPEMLAALRDSGWRDYSLFVDPAQALVVGYLVTDDFDRAQAAIDAHEVNTRWQQGMAEYFDVPEGAGPITRLSEYFHLD